MKTWTAIAIAVSLAFTGAAPSHVAPFLKQGNTIRYLTTGKTVSGESYSEVAALTIQSVVEKNGHWRMTGNLNYYNDRKEITSSYLEEFALDSTCFYVFTANWCYVNVQDDSRVSSTYSGDSIAYPFAMKVGDTLKGGTAIERTDSNGGMSEYTIVFTNRKVISLDTLTMPFGETAAFRIRSKVSNHARASFGTEGNKDVEFIYELTEWFNPAMGVIRSEYDYSGGGNAKMVMDSYGK